MMENSDLLVDGVSAHLIDDATLAQSFDSGSHLILWNADASKDIWISAYDVRTIFGDYNEMKKGSDAYDPLASDKHFDAELLEDILVERYQGDCVRRSIFRSFDVSLFDASRFARCQ